MAGHVFLYGLAVTTNLVFQTNVDLFHREIAHYGLAVPTPIRAEHLRRFSYNPKQQSFALLLTNGWRLSFYYGKLISFESPIRSNPKLGSIQLTNSILAEPEAVKFAREFARKTGLSDRQMYLHLDPEVSTPRMPWHPFFNFRWRAPNEWSGEMFEVTIDCRDRSVVSGFLPALFGHLVRAEAAKHPHEPGASLWPASPRPDPAVENRLLKIVCELLRRWAPDGGYPTNRVDENTLRQRVDWRFADTANPEKWWHANVFYTNAAGGVWGFALRNGRLTCWNPPDDFFFVDHPDVEDYAGVWRMSERQAADLVRQQVKKMGFPPKRLTFLREKPDLVQKPHLVGNRHVVPRIRLQWKQDAGSEVDAEVDADARRIKRLVVNLAERDDPIHFQ